MFKTFKGFGVAGAVAVALAGCATSSTPTQPSVARSPAPALDGRMEVQASAFESFMRRGRSIGAGFSSASDVSAALQAGAAHEPRQLEAGMIAYAAMAALQEPSFVAGVQRAGRDGSLARNLVANPMTAAQLPGADAAAGRASAALQRQGEALAGQGQKVKRASYTIQHQGWSKARVADAAGRLSRVKRISAAAYQPTAADRAQLRDALAQGGRRGGAVSPVVARGMALAALAVLGQEDRGRALMSEPRAGLCLRIAKLNLYQCLAAAGPQYEDVYCLGQHALIDPGQCVADAAKPPPRSLATRASYRRQAAAP